MSTAQIIYEQYKVLPKRVKKELVELIMQKNDELFTDISLPAIKEGLKELKSVLKGESEARPVSELLKELTDEAQ